ncbi:MAG: SDR family NAD(P)-dependent oxidoreductase [Candidatus Acidiferrales bacterium]|jgi:NAD(P)-dependent dehydrogenase (short-subunit alcohol dehydrogenase family)
MNWNQMLEGKVAIVTGGGSGIGRATSRVFAEHGARVMVADINGAPAAETAASIVAKGGEAISSQTDVGKMADVERMVKETAERWGRLDVIFSNAAGYKLGSATELSEEDWDRTLDVCLKASWMIAHHAMPFLLRQPGSTFIITGSVHSLRGYAKHVAYQASKGGLLALTRSLAADYAPTVRVNAILPGAVITGIAAHLTESQLEHIAMMCPLQRNSQPEEIGRVALFLASEMSSYMTGTALIVDGGLASVIKTD